MGKEEQTRSELSESKLIDFLYIDKSRVDSLISQIRNGTLRSVTKTTGTSEGSSVSAEGCIPPIASGNYGHTSKSHINAAENYDPYHSQILNLLNDLMIEPLDVLPEHSIGRLVILNATINIRDIRSIKAITPLIIKNKKLLKIPSDRNTNEFFRLVDDLVKQMDDAIDLTVSFNGDSVKGVLQESSLCIKPADINRTYGVQMPGSWYILGILDSVVQPINPPSAESFESAIDAFTNAIRQIYSQPPFTIIPILIYRAITY